MAKFEDSTFEDSPVSVDGNEYDRCTFRRCTLVYAGLGPVSMTNSKFDSCQWRFDGAAGRTIGVLRNLHAGGWKEMVENIAEEITNRKPVPPGTVTH